MGGGAFRANPNQLPLLAQCCYQDVVLPGLTQKLSATFWALARSACGRALAGPLQPDSLQPDPGAQAAGDGAPAAAPAGLHLQVRLRPCTAEGCPAFWVWLSQLGSLASMRQNLIEPAGTAPPQPGHVRPTALRSAISPFPRACTMQKGAGVGHEREEGGQGGRRAGQDVPG